MDKQKIPVAFYARVSSEDQAETDSIQHQFMMLEQALTELPDADEYYTEPSLWYADEGVSAHSTALNERKEMQRLLTDARNKKFGMVMAKASNRIARDNEESLRISNILEHCNVRFKLLLGGYDSKFPDSKILLTFSGIIDQKFSDDLSINLSTSLKTKALKGEWAALQAPRGYTIDKRIKKLIVNDDADIVRKIFHWYGNELIGTQLISERLNSMGFKTARGNNFDKSQVLYILSNRAYIGDTVYGKTRNKIEKDFDEFHNTTKKKKVHAKSPLPPIVIEKTHEAIIDELLFWKVQEIMRDRAHNRSHRTRAKYPLVGIIKCARCGSAMICQKKEGNKFRYYKCAKRFRFGASACETMGIRAQPLEQFLLQKIIDYTESFLTNVGETSTSESPDISVIEDKIRQQENFRKKYVKKQKDMILESDESDFLTKDVYDEIMIDLKNKIVGCDEQISVLQKQLDEIKKSESNTMFAHDFLDRVKRLNPEDETTLRVLFNEVIESIRMLDNETIESVDYRYKFLYA